MMSAYRNYNNNNKALSGNLEKLSSGYKINRAGDDAAGLAISEKMRAQITGLEAAQKNVKDGIGLTINDPTGTAKAGFTITAGAAAVKLEVSEDDLVDLSYAKVKGDKVSSEDLAAAIAEKNTLVTLNGLEYNVTADGKELVFTAAENPTTEVNAHYSVTFNSAITPSNNDAVGISYSTGKFTAGTGTNTDHKASITATINGKDYTFETAEQTGTITAGQWASAIGNATATIDGKSVKLSQYFDVKAVNDGTNDSIKFEDKTKTEEGSGNSVSGVTFASTADTATGAVASVAGGITKGDYAPAYSTGVNGYSNFGTQDIKVNSQSQVDQLASTSISLGQIGITDGMKIKLGDTEYTFAVGADSKYKDAENVVDLTDLKAADLSGTSASSTVLATAVSRLTDVAEEMMSYVKNNILVQSAQAMLAQANQVPQGVLQLLG